MPVVEGFQVLTSAYLGQDWDLFGSTVDESIVNFARGQSAHDVAAAIRGLEDLVASPMTEDDYYRRWIFELHSGYDPRNDGMTFREWFAHALQLLRSEAAKT